jgi:hypothetical protein
VICTGLAASFASLPNSSFSINTWQLTITPDCA